MEVAEGLKPTCGKQTILFNSKGLQCELLLLVSALTFTSVDVRNWLFAIALALL